MRNFLRVFIIIFLLVTPSIVFGEGITKAIVALQPEIGVARANKLAGYIVYTGDENSIDPLLITSIIMAESSFSYDVETGKRLGKRGERGLLQLFGAALKVLPGCNPRLDVFCNIRAGTRWLSDKRTSCSGSTYRWVSSYRRKTCASERQAGMDYHVRQIKEYYDRVDGSRW